VDGGSTDRSLEIIEKYRQLYPDRIRDITGRDKGVGDAVSKGFKLAKGDIFGWIDTDDFYEPGAIQTVVDFFRANPSAMLVYGGCNEVGEDGQAFACFIIKDFNRRQALNEWSYIMFCAAFYRRQLIDAVGSFNNLGNDLDFWLRVNKRFQMYRIENLLANWRLHNESISLNKSTEARHMRHKRIQEDFFLALRHGGNLLANRPGRYYGIIILEMIEILRPVLGFSYPFLWRCSLRGVKFMDGRMGSLRCLRYERYPLLGPVLSFVLRTWERVRGGIWWTFRV
jgi:glycosyltransferase involved in cell wall biosynthesis